VSLESFGLEGYTSGLLAASAVLTFLEHTQKMNLKHIRTIKPYSIDRYLQMNFTTYKNLELTESLREGKKEGTLLSTLDYCLTSMGKREIKRWIDRPLMDVELINRRLQSVKEIKENLVLKEQIKQHLGTIYDLERLAGKLGSGLANPRDLLSIKLSAQMLGGIKNHLNACKSGLLSWICQLDALTDVRDIIETSINDDAPATIKEGNIIKSGYNTEIDELRAINQQGAKWLVNFENQERTRTGIKNLKVGFNKVYGYYIEVSKANQHLVPPDYYRKQTLVNGERYVCEELKQYEEKLTTAHDRLIALEAEMFEEIRNRLALHIDRILDTANRIAVLDVLYSLASAAYLHDYVMPGVDYSGKIEIKSGRHPVVENTLKSGFVPNDIKIDREDRRFCLITGPNMGGKSTFMRQVALIVVMAQIGSFVPAEQAHIGVVDKIFTRVGASDDLAAGQSTFMVEMIEVASMLNNATESSLIILDEIGRGTSTYDGLSLAYSVSEYIHEVIRAKTLFATHYHELTALADRYKGMINLTVAVKEVDNSVVFLKKVLPGKADKSYGIHVAKLAGLPEAVINRSEEILSGLETKPVTFNHNNICVEQPGLFSCEALLLDELKSLNLDGITPKQALDILYGWTTRLKIEQ
ncbi:MAG: DNA mismatch repair protein MutS, partial [Syntrophomonadaceae bacterium]|nr:DNA mismatch repair protein MutS [Syntrophomonadaceae bacterium]